MNLINSTGNIVNNIENDILFVTFNQDYTSLAVGTKTGYRLYTLNIALKLEEIYSCAGEDVCIVERLFSSSLVSVVSQCSPRKLKVFHFKKGNEICNYCYSNTILSVRLNRNRLVVCLEERIDIHNIRDMKVIHTIRDIPTNSIGLCALSYDNDKSYLAYPSSSTTGEIQIFDTINLRGIVIIPAHDGPIAALSFDSTASKLATASEKGTVIRIFSIPSGKKIFEFRRGVRRCATIQSMSFSPDSMYLSVSSNLETVHVFKLETNKEKTIDDNSSWTYLFNRAVHTASSYLPANATEVFTQDRAFAYVHLSIHSYDLKTVCALTYIQKKLNLLIACSNGQFYVYEVNTDEGGECKLVSQPSSFYKIENPKYNKFENSSTFYSVMNEEINNLDD